MDRIDKEEKDVPPLRIREILKSKNISTKDLSEKLNMTTSGLNQNISGNPSLAVLNRIAKAIDVPLWHFFVNPQQVITPPQVIAQFYFKGSSYFATSFLEIKGLIAKFEESLENQMENP